MKFFNTHVGLALLVLSTAFKILATPPQSPEAWGLEAGQTTLFNGGKYYLVLVQPVADPLFQAIGIDTQFGLSGKYDYGMFMADMSWINSQSRMIGDPVQFTGIDFFSQTELSCR